MHDPAATETSRIVANGGWVETKRCCKPRALLFLTLSILWAFPSLGALVIIGTDFFRWLEAASLLEGLQMVRLEQWLALGLLVLHPAFVWLAYRYHRHEQSKEVVALEPNPEHNLRKLY